MSIHITKKSIHATGNDANGLFIAMAPDSQLLDWDKSQTGSEEFRRMVKSAIVARGIQTEQPK